MKLTALASKIGHGKHSGTMVQGVVKQVVPGSEVHPGLIGALTAYALAPEGDGFAEGAIRANSGRDFADVKQIVADWLPLGDKHTKMARELARWAGRRFPNTAPDEVAAALLLAATMVYAARGPIEGAK